MRVAPRAASVWLSDVGVHGAARRSGSGTANVELGLGVNHARPAVPLSQDEFRRGLASRPRARSEHFLLHHLGLTDMPVDAELSTSSMSAVAQAVDGPRRLGLIVPKRHARRAVSRNLIRRQGRHAFERFAPRLAPGDWFLRLRAPFPTQQFPSAASDALKAAVWCELNALFAAASS